MIEYRAQIDIKFLEILHNNNYISILVDSLNELRFTEALGIIQLLQNLFQVYFLFSFLSPFFFPFSKKKK